MKSEIYNDITEFLLSRNIVKVDKFLDIKEISSEEEIKKHLEVICDFHKTTEGFKGYISKRINNYTGKKVEDYKVYIKKLQRDLKKLQVEGAENCIEELLLKEGSVYLDRGEKAVKAVSNINYYGLINRSMKAIELCIGNSHSLNLRRNGDTIEVINLSRCGYNMVEWDCIYYLNKLKKKGEDCNYKELIRYFCTLEKLGEESEIFIRAMLSYPIEFMKSYTRYKYRKKEWSNEDYASNLKLAIEKEEQDILI